MYKIGQIIKNLTGRDASFECVETGGKGTFFYKNVVFLFVFSSGEGWDHLSVSIENRCPTWNEMCMMKDIFWPPHEACLQYHPAQKDYINNHPYTLHIWRPSDGVFPSPPTVLIGI
jgi:hypothetical protein